MTRWYEWHAEGTGGNGSTEVAAPKGAWDAHMKMTVAMAALCGLLPAHRVADAPQIERPHWVVVATLINRYTGHLARARLRAVGCTSPQTSAGDS